MSFSGICVADNTSFIDKNGTHIGKGYLTLALVILGHITLDSSDWSIVTMKIAKYSGVLLFLHYICHAYAGFWDICCYAQRITFINKRIDRKCDHYGARTSFNGDYCSIWACGDGLPLAPSSWYCGVGPCNGVGCNCNDGCIPGDPINSFKMLWGDEVTAVTFKQEWQFEYGKKN